MIEITVKNYTLIGVESSEITRGYRAPKMSMDGFFLFLGSLRLNRIITHTEKKTSPGHDLTQICQKQKWVKTDIV